MAPRRWGASGHSCSAAEGIFNFEAAPARLQLAPAPAEPAAAYAYAGAIPGPLVRLRQGEELRLKFGNKLDEPTTLSFPGLRAANSAAGIGGLTQERLKPGASADIRFTPQIPASILTCPAPAQPTLPSKGMGSSARSIVDEPKAPDVELDAAAALSDWNVDASGQIKDDFADPAISRGSGRKGGVVFANGAAAPLKLKARPGARVRLRLGSAATARLATVAIDGARTVIVAVDGQPSQPFEPLNNQFPMGPGARFELMFDMPRDLGAGVRLDLRGAGGDDRLSRSCPGSL